jgi:outer membrane receptor protein involved in Fe transport
MRILSASVLALMLAQTAGAAEPDESGPTEIVVTGSRIANTTGMTTPTPVTAVSAEELRLMSPGTMISSLSRLPQFYGNTSSDNPGNFFSSPGSGNLNLRGLNTGNSSSRTLTLLDGRRVVPATRLGGVDINILPESLVKRVDTVTGGASAAYGTDAVSGVVNFILDTDYTGWQVNAQKGATSRSDNDSSEFSATFGTNLGDRAHLLLNAEYYEHDGVFGYEGRDWYRSWGLITNPMGSPPQEVRRPDVVSTTSSFGGVIVAPATSALNRLHFLPDGSAVPFVLGEGTVSGLGSHSITNGGSGDFIGNEMQTIAPDARRGNAFVYFDYDATPNLNLYVQGLAGRSMTDTPNFGGLFSQTFSTQITIFRDNPFLPDNIRQIMANENLASFVMNRTGSREDTAVESRLRQDNKTYSGTVGFKYNIAREGFLNDWHVDGYYQYGTARNRGFQQGLRLDRVYAALDAVVDPATNNIVCRAALINPAKWGDCVPLDYFGQGRASDEAVAYVTQFEPGQTIESPLYFTRDGYGSGRTISYTSGLGKVYLTDTEQTLTELSASGVAWRGWGAGPVSAAFGVAYRKEEIDQIVQDPSNPASDPAFFPARDPAVRGIPSNASTRTSAIQNSTVPNIAGDYDVKEVFSEWQVPLVSDVPLVRQLNLLAAGRYAEYEGSGGIWAWKGGLDWEMFESLRLRGTVSRDIRAGTLAERYDMTGGLGNLPDDPQFPGGGPTSVTIRTGGNPNLSPEEADTRTFGFVYTPGWLGGLSLSADYWDIDISGAIGALGVQRVVDDCFAGSAAMCALVTRDPVTGRVIQVLNSSQNINAAAGRGVDIEIAYTRPIRLFRKEGETLALRLFGARMLENSTTNLGAAKVDRAGQTGSGFPLPKDNFTANVTYGYGPFNLFLQTRYIGSGIRDVTQVEGVRIDDNSIESALYTDVRLGYSMEAHGGQLEVFGNVLNVFDESPSVVPSFDSFTASSGQVNGSLFDLLGRRYTVGVRYRF